jgi:hypothetical protein
MQAPSYLRAALAQHLEDEPQAFNNPVGSVPWSDFTINRQDRKAFEAPGAIADEATRKRCRLAVMQELDGVCTVFLTHNDSSWPPTREQLKVIPTQRT